MLIILSVVDGKTVKEIAEETGIKEKAVYHLMELLKLVDLVEERNGRYYSEYREMAEILLQIRRDEDILTAPRPRRGEASITL